jgi:phosphate transport system protein
MDVALAREILSEGEQIAGNLRQRPPVFEDGAGPKAIGVCRRDVEVDNINRQLYRELTSFMVEKPETISRAIELMFILKSIERTADHATNIAEETILLIKGKDVRHTDEVKHIGSAI